MNIYRLAAAALVGAVAWGGAQADTLYSENFNAGNTFTGGTRVNDGPDDYLLLSLLSPTASRDFSFAQNLTQVTLSFWFSGPFANNGTVTLTKTNAPTGTPLSDTLGDTPGGVVQYGHNNPGPGNAHSGAFDAQYTFTLPSLSAGDYTLTFSKAAGPLHSLKLDDVVLTALPVPEPETYALMLGGLGIVAWVARRRRPHRD